MAVFLCTISDAASKADSSASASSSSVIAKIAAASVLSAAAAASASFAASAARMGAFVVDRVAGSARISSSLRADVIGAPPHALMPRVSRVLAVVSGGAAGCGSDGPEAAPSASSLCESSAKFKLSARADVSAARGTTTVAAACSVPAEVASIFTSPGCALEASDEGSALKARRGGSLVKPPAADGSSRPCQKRGKVNVDKAAIRSSSSPPSVAEVGGPPTPPLLV